MINKPSILIQDDNSVLTRQTQELLRALQPIFNGAYVPDQDWNDIQLMKPWTNAGDLKFQERVLLDGVTACHGRISTTGGDSAAKAVANGAIPATSYVKLSAAICTFPVKPKHDIFLPPQAVFAYDLEKKPFYSACLLSIQTDGTMCLEVLLDRTDAEIAVGWLNIDFTRFM